MAKILFLEDSRKEHENVDFVRVLQNVSKNVELEQPFSVMGFENHVKKPDCDIIILDIMVASPENLRWTGTEDKERVPESLVGIELLRRCRNGSYGAHYKQIPIYMRTARGEEEIKDYCLEVGANGYFAPGSEDAKLIDCIKGNLRAKADKTP